MVRRYHHNQGLHDLFLRMLYADSPFHSFRHSLSSSLSLNSVVDDHDKEDQIVFRSYRVENFELDQDMGLLKSLYICVSVIASATSNRSSTHALVPEPSDPIDYAEDDSAVQLPPSRHVDYLSHNWEEEDIWSS